MNQEEVPMNIRESNFEEKFEYYKSLLSLSYDELIHHLRLKYGVVDDDYFREKSYQRFLNDEIKSIRKGNFSRTSEGLYTHHVFENKYENLSNKDFIREYRYPYKLQKFVYLVYCDLYEHLILHARITLETNGEYGYQGYRAYLLPMVIEWFSWEIIPSLPWMQNCYRRAYLPPDLTRSLLILINATLPDGFQEEAKWINMSLEEYEEQNRIFLEELSRKQEEREKRMEQAIKKEKIRKALEKEEKQKIFEKNYPKLTEAGIKADTPRRKLEKLYYEIENYKYYETERESEKSMVNLIRQRIIDQLEELL